MTTAVMLIAQQVFRDEEYSLPRAVLESHGVEVVTASEAEGPCSGKLGLVAQADMSLAQAVKREWDAVIFVGGAGAARFFDDPLAHELAAAALRGGAVLAAICIAPSTLARAGLLKGRQATAFPSQREDLIDHGAAWVDLPVVVDGSIITANGPDAAERFGEAIAAALGV